VTDSLTHPGFELSISTVQVDGINSDRHGIVDEIEDENDVRSLCALRRADQPGESIGDFAVDFRVERSSRIFGQSRVATKRSIVLENSVRWTRAELKRLELQSCERVSGSLRPRLVIDVDAAAHPAIRRSDRLVGFVGLHRTRYAERVPALCGRDAGTRIGETPSETPLAHRLTLEHFSSGICSTVIWYLPRSPRTFASVVRWDGQSLSL